MDQNRRYYGLLLALGVVLIALFVISLLTGSSSISLMQGLSGLFGAGDSDTVLIMQQLRLPRALLGAMIGLTLGLSGAALQGYLRNPLAEPGLLGVSSSASLGAVLALYSGLSLLFPLSLPLMALGFAFIAVILVQFLAGGSGSTITVILAGVAVSAFAGALTSLALSLAPNPFALMEIVFWMLGSLNDRSMSHVWLVLPFMSLGWIMLILSGRSLDALTLGQETAASMGVDLRKVQFLVVAGTAMSVGAATAVAGAIGFIGLVVPHVLRPFVGSRPSRLLPASALGGAVMLLAADIFVRLILPEKDLKLGVLTALIGAPFFLHLVSRLRKGAEI
ncbi:iron complex transport system permease protein [Pseudochrobactrum saccharolyticum]|uniref:Iron complex transport system permease protein n=1 Tax=Pseudochrobactrum saccharolyticum TaxID=354352 RepID=A0A7W8AJ43_9HYPH|nr:iron ABC transporter permease [Pseudochrobactrum saccharolyticum]KAB0540652.1 iron ABC transporter permease [Pseudochrobactrum saccharolyticum]MBB5090221.1 iron complex transport system permease protein [Pseudochrobactrum saccharolyticum]